MGESLRHLAIHYGVEPSYWDAAGTLRQVSPETLSAVLRALGAPLGSPADAAALLQDLPAPVLPPVTVIWDDNRAKIPLELSNTPTGNQLRCRLRLESGERRQWDAATGELALSQAPREGGRRAQLLAMPEDIPWGYHSLEVELDAQAARSLVICAPPRVYGPPAGAGGRRWGVFAPLYALHSKQSVGIGDFSDLKALSYWAGKRGASFVGTLPLLPGAGPLPADPSPYRPGSRLFWNELFVDPGALPEFQECPRARLLLESDFARKQMARLMDGEFVDYEGAARFKRQILEELARHFFRNGAAKRREALAAFEAEHPDASAYAKFQAAWENFGEPWPRWPAGPREGKLSPGDYGEEARRYHLYVQWAAAGQLGRISDAAGPKAAGLYLDLPLGTDPSGFDAWRFQGLFAEGASVGAPPDPFFSGGQDWAFQPLHPGRIREEGHAYWRRVLRHHLEAAALLRIDHVMGLHRLWWIPDGASAKEGAYVRYPAEELYAALSVESHRARTEIVGEDLGTVADETREAMDRHGVLRSYVLQFHLPADPAGTPKPPPADSIASFGTHDLPTFAGFWKGRDIEISESLGSLAKEESAPAKNARTLLREALEESLRGQGLLAADKVSAEELLEACLIYLGKSPAGIVLVQLEDLWLEEEPQNVPGTSRELPNWRRRLRYAVEEFQGLPVVESLLARLAAARKASE